MKTCLLTVLFIVLFNPLFFAGTYSGGSGTSESPYQIANLNDLAELSGASGDWNKYFIQTANIDASSTSSWNGNAGWSPVGSSGSNFTGSYNGQSYTVSGLSINRSAYNQGFFGYTNGATIKNIGLTSVNISGNGNVGALIGYASASAVSSCYCTGNVSGYYGYIGGLIGDCANSCTIYNCYSTTGVSGGTSGSGAYTGGLIGRMTGSTIDTSYHTTGSVSGRDYVGGLVGGCHSSTITKSYSTGSVSGTQDVGGLVGYNAATLSNSYSRASTSNSGSIQGGLVGRHDTYAMSNCYSTGAPSGGTSIGGLIGAIVNAGSVSSSFWDTETSGQLSSAGGIGKPTTEMKTLSTFTDAGWSSSLWNLDAGYNDGYPHLDWQNPGGSPLPVELISFTANVGTDFITLHWQTATEVGNYGFEVEKAVGSASTSLSTRKQSAVSNWEKVGFIAGAGNSNTSKNYSFVDSDVTSGKYFYRLKQINTNGSFEYSNEIEIEITQPKEFSLYQNYPNPFNPTTTIKYSISLLHTPLSGGIGGGFVTLEVYDILGNEVATLENEKKSAGNYEVKFDASNLASGIYLYKLQSGEFVSVKKLMLLK